MVKLKRLSDTPVLEPVPNHAWEAAAVFNTAAVKHNDLVHLIYRATDITSNGEQGKYLNSLGYASSPDGLKFDRLEKPILINDVPQELRGPEDPRIIDLDGTFYMIYTGYGGRFDGDYRISLATSKNLVDWDRKGVLLDEPNKDASLFPQKINGKYVMIHRRSPDIWIAYSEDLKTWQDHQRVMEPRMDLGWDSTKIGLAGPPFKTPLGWLMIYHGVGGDPRKYSLGIALLDGDDPSQVITRQAEPILEPELDWEINGFVPNVVFSCGQVKMDDQLLVYYGGADQVIGVAGVPLKDINQFGAK